MWLFYTLLAVFFYGVGQILAKKGLDHITPLFNNIISLFAIFAFTIPYALFNGVHFDSFFHIYFITLFICALYISYYYILNLGQVSLTFTIVSSFPIVTVILSLVFLHERLNIYQGIAIGLVIMGTLILSLPEKISMLKKFKPGSWFWWALFGSVTYGIANFLSKIIITER